MHSEIVISRVPPWGKPRFPPGGKGGGFIESRVPPRAGRGGGIPWNPPGVKARNHFISSPRGNPWFPPGGIVGIWQFQGFPQGANQGGTLEGKVHQVPPLVYAQGGSLDASFDEFPMFPPGFHPGGEPGKRGPPLVSPLVLPQGGCLEHGQPGFPPGGKPGGNIGITGRPGFPPGGNPGLSVIPMFPSGFPPGGKPGCPCSGHPPWGKTRGKPW